MKFFRVFAPIASRIVWFEQWVEGVGGFRAGWEGYQSKQDREPGEGLSRIG